MRHVQRLLSWLRSLVVTGSDDDDDGSSIDDVREVIEREVAAGFLTPDEMLNAAVDMFDGTLPHAEARLRSETMLAAALAEHRAAQATWPAVTDCDRLDQAFASLEGAGLLARQNFTCCGTCGVAEIHEAMTLATAEGRQIRGYAFFHQQDTESAVDGGGLYLNYGALKDGKAPAIAVGREIARTIEQQGLRVDWNGSLDQRIAVSLDWKRRRPLL